MNLITDNVAGIQNSMLDIIIVIFYCNNIKIIRNTSAKLFPLLSRVYIVRLEVAIFNLDDTRDQAGDDDDPFHVLKDSSFELIAL